MEKIVIFIIIMIVSSYFSKKKRKRANFTSTKKTDTTFFDGKGNKVSGSRSSSKPIAQTTAKPQSISDALSELKNIFSNTPQQQPKPEPVYETNYGEISTEANDSDYTEKDYKEVQIKYESQNTVKEKPASLKPTENNSYAIKTKKIVYRKDILTGLFSTKNELKKAVIINEVFNKKY
ncbi:MAG: hypothetical protein KAH33_04595 [Candidatus Delongbacteria bacterium]|nr:hypothetical protein [Candidatus Delongbacteria bacterium]